MHQLTTTKSVAEAVRAVVNALQTAQPAFVFSESKPFEQDTFVLEARQEVPDGYRRCVIVGGQT
jgi:CO dehydrogenase/acetyl-CoA synthase delta subunit